MGPQPNTANKLLALFVSFGLWASSSPALGAAPQVPEPSVPASAATPSSPEERAAAVLPLVVEGDALAETDRVNLTNELVEGLERGAFDVMKPEQVVAADVGASSCTEAGCFKTIAKATGATHIVRAVVTISDRDYEIRVALVDGQTGQELATSQQGCEICGVVDAGELMGTAAATLRTKLDALSAGPSTLQVASTPEGAEIYIDGELKGTTPFDGPVLPGKHVMRVSKEGFITVEREVTFVEGVEENLSFELEKVPSRLPARPWGWVSLGLGIAGIGTAIGFAAIRDLDYKLLGRCRRPIGENDDGALMDGDGNCRYLFNTEYHVLGTALAGAALTTLGVAILLNSSVGKRRGKSKDRARLSDPRRPRVSVGPNGVMLRGRF